ncbi:MAG: hypothetical protein ABFC88_13035 [Thermoguttaceae bacterium]
MRTVYVDWYAPWSGPLSPARRLVLNVLLLVAVPWAALLTTVWVVNFPWGRYNESGRPIEEWKKNEPVVRQVYHFDHEEYVKWLSEQ